MARKSLTKINRKNGSETFLKALWLKYSLSGLCIIAGFVLSLLGFAGGIELFELEAPGFKAKLVNASPGVFLVVIGLLVLRFWRIHIEIEETNQENVTRYSPPTASLNDPGFTGYGSYTQRKVDQTYRSNMHGDGIG